VPFRSKASATPRLIIENINLSNDLKDIKRVFAVRLLISGAERSPQVASAEVECEWR
jgi:hypothetical protein